MTLADLISVARGAQPADLRLENAWLVNVFNGEVEATSLTVYGEYVAGIGDSNSARETIDLAGRYVVPGLIDGHVHLESSMLDVGEYARAVVPHGTSAIAGVRPSPARRSVYPAAKGFVRKEDQVPLGNGDRLGHGDC